MKSFYFWKRLLCCFLAMTACAAVSGCKPKTPPTPDDEQPPVDTPPLYTTPISEVIVEIIYQASRNILIWAIWAC